MDQKNLVDSLPYIDKGYDNSEVKDIVFKMIEEETKRYKPTKNYLEYLPPVNLTAFETEIMKNEMERIAARQRMELIDMKRYQLPDPPPGKSGDVGCWTDALNNSAAQLEHQLNRKTNLDLMNEYASDAWICYNENLAKMSKQQQERVEKLKEEIKEINWNRKKIQTSAGDKLATLESRWVDLVAKNFEIERACVQLELEIQQLEKKNTVEESGE